MRWSQGRRSGNIEDRRGMRMPGGRVGGIGLFGLLIALVAMFFGFDPGLFLGPRQQIAPPQQQTSAPSSPEAEQMRDFVSVILGETEATWEPIFQEAGADYREPTLVLYSGLTQTACGTGQAAAGPFYCPADQKVYLDTSFFDEMSRRFGATGDFAQAYVIAHEVGHHVQTLLGITQEVEQVRRSGGRAANDTSVRFELQADCLAGVWANHTQARTGMLERGDIEEALNAASAIGDDRIQAQTQGFVVPDAFTHGSSEQRVRWFYAGLESGDLAACNTFDIAQP
jgi:predicted metalloprotease